MIELLTAFVIMAFLLGIGVVSYNFIIDRVAGNYYNTLEEELLLAGNDYFTNNRIERPLSGYSAVQIDELVGDKYIETLKDRNGNVCDSNSNSKVYIYKTGDSYGYEACLVCNDYKTEGTYCDGITMGVINISAVKEGGGSYNPLLSFANASWSNKNVTVTFSVTTDVTDFIITDINTGSKRTCNSITDRKCSMSFSSTSSYKVDAYYNGLEAAPSKGFNIKIDKEKPTCEFVSVTEDGNLSATYEDLGGSDISYFGYSSSFSGANTVSKQISSANTYKYYVKDKAGNENNCSVVVSGKNQYRYQKCNTCSSCEGAGCESQVWGWQLVKTGYTLGIRSCSLTFPYVSGDKRYTNCTSSSGQGSQCNFTGCNLYEKYWTCQTYNTSCSTCGCEVWNELDWNETQYDESANEYKLVETKTVYYIEK